MGNIVLKHIAQLMLNCAGRSERSPQIRRKVLLESETLQIALFEAHPASDACGDVERQQ